MNRLLILSKKRETYQNLLRSNKTLDRIELTDDISEANIILGEPPLVKDQLMLAKKLEWFQSIYTGVESIINTPSATNYQLTNVREGMGPLISEYILGYCIIHFRHLLQYHHLQQQNLWKPATYQSIHSKKMLIIGTGAIGQHLAHTASAFNIECFGLNRTGQQVPGFKYCESFNYNSQLIPQADIIVTVLPSTPESYHLINESLFSKAEQSIFFNVGRGATVCERSLLNALNQEQIQHAYLDVFEKEPLEKEHPFWNHPRVTITPHIAATSMPEFVFPLFIKNYLHFINNQPLEYLVNREIGY